MSSIAEIIDDSVDADAEYLKNTGRFITEDHVKEIDNSIINLVDSKTVLNFSMVPYQLDENRLTVITNLYSTSKSIDFLKKIIGCEIDVKYAFTSTIQNLVGRYYQEATQHDDSKERDKILELKSSIEPINNLIHRIIKESLKKNATDIHFCPLESGLEIKYRINKDLKKSGIMITDDQAPYVINIIKMWSGIECSEKGTPQDGGFSRLIDGELLEFRTSVLPDVRCEAIVLRLFNPQVVTPTIETVGLDEFGLKLLSELISATKGLTFVVGPMNSGKSTTIRAILKELDRKYNGERKIISLEDPVESREKGFIQCQVTSRDNGNRSFTFVQGLRAILRHDANIIFIGECRDPETTSTCVSGAVSGHIIFSTIHAGNVADAAARVLDMGGDILLTASNLNGIIAQRLVKYNCPDCKSPYEPDLGELSEEEHKILFKDGVPNFKMGRGCLKCNWTGIAGLKVLFEILVMDDHLRSFLSEKPSPIEIKEYLQKVPSYRSLRKYGLALVRAGEITYENLSQVVEKERRCVRV